VSWAILVYLISPFSTKGGRPESTNLGSLRIIELAFINLLVSNCMVAPAGSSAQDVYL